MAQPMAASGYALPRDGGSHHHHHAHGHSYSGAHLSPGKTARHSYTGSNGSIHKLAVSNSPLFTHAETSRETSPVFFPNAHHTHNSTLEQNVQAFRQNGHLSSHKHSHSTPVMKSRPRGESDLGRPADPKSAVYRPSLSGIPAAPASWLSLPEALTSMILTAPFLFASLAYSSTSASAVHAFPPLAAYSTPNEPTALEAESTDGGGVPHNSAFILAGILTSGTLLVVGMAGKIRVSERELVKDRGVRKTPFYFKALLEPTALRSMIFRSLSVYLALYAAMTIGGSRTALILLVAIAADLICADRALGSSFEQWKQLWASNVATSVVILLCFIADEAQLTIHASLMDLILGYLALATSILAFPPPFPTLASPPPGKARAGNISSTPMSIAWSQFRSDGLALSIPSQLISSPINTDLTLLSGTGSALLTVLASVMTLASPLLSPMSLFLITLAVASMAGALLFSQPSALRSQSKAGLALGCLITASSSFLFSPSLWPGTVCNGGLAALAYLAALYDTDETRSEHSNHDAPDSSNHKHRHHHSPAKSSAFTKLVLARCEPGSLVHTILSDKDSRRIAYFTMLNFAFMLVQGAYGYMSGSLGLLSDTVHMLFDCLGLIVGLGAAVASKWPISPEKPYGWGKLNTLAGFGNGIFLMLVSIEFIWEAIEGILEERELRHVEELLVVSTLGLLVNLIGLFAFGHAHAGHDHGHSHGHSHGHGHGHSHLHSKGHDEDNHVNGHAHGHGCQHDHDHDSHTSHGAHHHHEHNENMHGIFLHVAADAGGSLAVIISTALTLWKPWYLWDPLATILIAVLIFAAAVPLVFSSGQKLLLVVPNELEYSIKETLQELGDLRGVVGYTVPRFWIDDKDEAAGTDGEGRKKVMGVVHVIAASVADLDDVQERVEAFVAERNMNIIIHVEREEEQCWCGRPSPHIG